METYPRIEPYIEGIWPKKAQVQQLKIRGWVFNTSFNQIQFCRENSISFYQIDGEILFLEIRDKPILPMLRLLHKYPFMMDPMQCDKGAIKHIFTGSHVMAPGLTSPGGVVCPDLDVDAPVAITAEGKQHAMAIGILTMDSESIVTQNKGQAIEVY